MILFHQSLKEYNIYKNVSFLSSCRLLLFCRYLLCTGHIYWQCFIMFHCLTQSERNILQQVNSGANKNNERYTRVHYGWLLRMGPWNAMHECIMTTSHVFVCTFSTNKFSILIFSVFLSRQIYIANMRLWFRLDFSLDFVIVC